MIITKENLGIYLKGSLFLATGGGLPKKLHENIFKSVLNNNKKLKAISLNAFKNDDILISAYGVGDPSKIPNNFTKKVEVAFDKFKSLTNIEIKGIIPGEIGSEGLAFQIAYAIGLPVVDSDLVGGRAAPEIQLDVFSVFDLNIAPVLLFALNGKSIFLEGNFLAKEIEEISRNFFDKNGSSGILIGYDVRVSEYEKYAVPDTLTNALEIGKLLQQKDKNKLKLEKNIEIVYEGQIINADLQSKGGFLVGKVILENSLVKVKNENISFIKSAGEKINAPDILMFVDEDFNPIHNTQIKDYIDKRVMLMYIPAIGYWQKNKAKELW